MSDVVIGAAFVAIVLIPAIVASLQIRKSDK